MRASSHNTIFDKGYMSNWTKKHFIIRKAVPPKRGTKRRIYKLVDYNDKHVTLYLEEIQEISDNQYRIEKVLRKRTLPKSAKKLFVR